MSFFLREKIDFAKHNDEVGMLMRAFEEGSPSRVPLQINGSIRNLLCNAQINRTGYSFQDFFTSAAAQIDCQLAYQYYCRHNFHCDMEMGIPEKWQLCFDLQNSYDQAWFGCPIYHINPGDVPDTGEILKEDPDLLYSWGEPDAFFGRGDIVKRALEMFEEMKRRCAAGLEFHGKAVLPPTFLPWMGTDGIFDCAIKMRGAMEIMLDMYDTPHYFHDLMEYLATNLIRRIRAHRRFMSQNIGRALPEKWHFCYADDSIAMLSCEQFEEFIFPHTKRIFDEFCDESGCMIHLCGNATHHFKFLQEKFNVKTFDTGFPVDHGKLRRTLGTETVIRGGPTIMTVKDGTAEEIESESKRILQSGVCDGGKFIMIAANNLAPCTPVEHLQMLYAATKKYGKY